MEMNDLKLDVLTWVVLKHNINEKAKLVNGMHGITTFK